MKSTKDFRTTKRPDAETFDSGRKSVKLEPIRKSGKDRHKLFRDLDDDSEEEFFGTIKKSESVLDYIDDNDDDVEDWDQDDLDVDDDFEDEDFEEEDED